MEIRNCPQGAQTYLWAAGDTLMSVALRNGVSEQAVRQANPGINFDQLEMGAMVCIPQRSLMCVDGVLHPVRSGDTIESIARAHGVTAREVMDRNPYVDPTELRPGMLLCVPNRTEPEPAPTPSRPTPTPPTRPMPTPTPPTPAPQSQCPTGYTPGTVRYGETYADILLRYNVSYQAFRLTNPNLSLDRLLPGQRYCIPPTGTRGLCSVGARSYVMELSDTLAGVAARFNTTQAALLRLNANLAPSDFIPGRVICVA